MAKFELRKEDLEKLEEKIGKLQEVAEDEINRVLHNESSKNVSKSVQELINISVKKKGTHAKLGVPFKIETFNLGFFIKTYPKFNYLIFPDEGRGPKNKTAQDFTGRGIERERPKVVNQLLDVLTRKIEEEL